MTSSWLENTEHRAIARTNWIAQLPNLLCASLMCNKTASEQHISNPELYLICGHRYRTLSIQQSRVLHCQIFHKDVTVNSIYNHDSYHLLASVPLLVLVRHLQGQRKNPTAEPTVHNYICYTLWNYYPGRKILLTLGELSFALPTSTTIKNLEGVIFTSDSPSPEGTIWIHQWAMSRECISVID